MNIINIDGSDYILNNYEGVLKVNNPLKLTLSGNCNLVILDLQQNLEIFLKDNANVIINLFSFEKNTDNKIVTYQKNNTDLKIIESFINKRPVKEKIKNYLRGNNNNCEMVIRCISKFDISVDLLAKIEKNTVNNTLIQNARAITEKGVIEIKPNIEVDTLDVSANHFISILNIDKNLLKYLKNKGISDLKAKNLIKNGFLYNVFPENVKDLIKKGVL